MYEIKEEVYETDECNVWVNENHIAEDTCLLTVTTKEVYETEEYNVWVNENHIANDTCLLTVTTKDLLLSYLLNFRLDQI